MKRWYVVNTHARQEIRAESNLLRQGYEVWLPSFSSVKRHARSSVAVRSPVFPGYLFLRLDIQSERWYPVCNTFGVISLLTNDGRPAPLPDRFMGELRGHLGLDGDAPSALMDLTPGASLEMISGPFAGCTAQFLALAPRERVKVLLRVLGADFQATVPVGGVRIVA